MLQKIENYIQKHQLLMRKRQIIVGVSGGTDSVALLHVLISLGYNCVIAHCNFHLRTDESNRDEDFVRNLAKHYQIPFHSIDFQTTTYAETHKISIEMAARDLRYNWFNDLLEKTDAQAIAVAHHADDSIETLLMNLVRGTGLRGLTGIAARNKNVVRPLLCCTRTELENYLAANNLAHVEDSTNALSDYQRNKFRNEVLPLLAEINPSVRQTLYNSIERFEGNWVIYQQAIEQITEKIVEKQPGLIKINIEILKEQIHIPTILFELLHPYGFNSAQIEQISEQLDAESGRQFFSETHRLLKDRKHLIVCAKEQAKSAEYIISETDSQLTEPFCLEINQLLNNSQFQLAKRKNLIQMDAAKLQFPLTLRPWREGDVFFPFGMNKQQKISDFFINNKLSLIEKEQTWLLISGNDIVWIVGQRPDNRFRITPQTTHIIEFKIQD